MKKVLSLFLSLVMLSSITVGIDFSAYAATYYESESNNGYSSANYLPVNSTMYGISTDTSDDDWYKFTLSSPSKVNVTFSFTSKNISGNWHVRIYKYNGGSSYSELDHNIICAYDGTYKFSTLGLPEGTYFVYVDPCSSELNKIQYGVTVNSTQCDNWEREFNNEYASADTLTIGKTMYGVSTDTHDDWYKFTLSSQSQINVTFSFTSKNISGNWHVRIYKYNGGSSYSELDHNIICAYDGTYKFSTLGLPKGTYFVYVDPCSSELSRIQYGVTVNYFVSKPSKLKVSTRNTNSLKLSWSKVSGATGYQLQRKSGDNYKTLTNTKNTSSTVSKLSAGTTYKFRVRAYKTVSGKKYYSSWTYLTTPTKPSKPSIKAPSTNKKHQIIVKWKKVSKCSGYQVQYSKKKNFSSVIATKTVSGSSKTSYTGKNFTKGKTYYVRVRSYKTVNGTKYYSAWSSVKSIKCK